MNSSFARRKAAVPAKLQHSSCLFISVTGIGTGVNITCLLWSCACFPLKEFGRKIWRRVMRSWKILSWGNWVLDPEAYSGLKAITGSLSALGADCPCTVVCLPNRLQPTLLGWENRVMFSQINPLICSLMKSVCTVGWLAAGGQEEKYSPCPPVPKPLSSQAVSPNPCIWAAQVP